MSGRHTAACNPSRKVRAQGGVGDGGLRGENPQVAVDARATSSGWNSTRWCSWSGLVASSSRSSAAALTERPGAAGARRSGVRRRPPRTRCRRSRRWPGPGARAGRCAWPPGAARARGGRWRRRRRWGVRGRQGGQVFPRGNAGSDAEGVGRHVGERAAGMPAASQAPRAPASRSRTWPIRTGPPTKATRSCPSSRRCSRASDPPRTSSTATVQKRASLRVRSTMTSGVCRRTASSSRSVRVDRGDEDAFDPLLAEPVEIGLLPIGTLVAVAQEESQGLPLGDVLDPCGDIGEERVGGVEHDVGQRPALAGTQLAGRLVADEAQLSHGAFDALPGARADAVGAVEHVGHGAERDSRPRRDIPDGHP